MAPRDGVAGTLGGQGAAGAGDVPRLGQPLVYCPPRVCRGQPGDLQDRFHGAGGTAAGGAEGVRGTARCPLRGPPVPGRLGWLRCRPLPALPRGDGKGGDPGGPWPPMPGVLGLPGLALAGEHPAHLPTGRAPLQKESQKADEYLREIKDQKLLPEAVSQCVEAAGYEHEPDTQKSLLRVSEAEGAFGGGCGQLPPGWPAQPQHRASSRRQPPSASASSTNSPRRASCACARTCGCSTPSGTTRSASPSPSPSILRGTVREWWPRGGRRTWPGWDRCCLGLQALPGWPPRRWSGMGRRELQSCLAASPSGLGPWGGGL